MQKGVSEMKEQNPLLKDNPIKLFQNKRVSVELDDGFIVKGKLVSINKGNFVSHFPQILILENRSGKHIVRGNFFKVAEGKEHERF